MRQRDHALLTRPRRCGLLLAPGRRGTGAEFLLRPACVRRLDPESRAEPTARVVHRGRSGVHACRGSGAARATGLCRHHGAAVVDHDEMPAERPVSDRITARDPWLHGLNQTMKRGNMIRPTALIATSVLIVSALVGCSGPSKEVACPLTGADLAAITGQEFTAPIVRDAKLTGDTGWRGLSRPQCVYGSTPLNPALRSVEFESLDAEEARDFRQAYFTDTFSADHQPEFRPAWGEFATLSPSDHGAIGRFESGGRLWALEVSFDNDQMSVDDAAREQGLLLTATLIDATIAKLAQAPAGIETPAEEAPVTTIGNSPLDAVNGFYALMHGPAFTCEQLFEVITHNTEHPSAEVASRECSVYVNLAQIKKDQWPVYEVFADTLVVNGETAEVQVFEGKRDGRGLTTTLNLLIQDGIWKVDPQRL